MFRTLTSSFIAALLTSAAAQSMTPAAVLKLAEDNLSKAPWQGHLVGSATLQGDTKDVDITIRAIPSASGVMRFDIQKPLAFQDNFTVLDARQVMDYYSISNQVIIQPRSKAKLNDMIDRVSHLGHLTTLQDDFDLKTVTEVNSPAGAAWLVSGAPKKANLGYTAFEILIAKTNPHPVSLTFKDGGKTVGTLELRDFKRAAITLKSLMAYPADAQVVKK